MLSHIFICVVCVESFLLVCGVCRIMSSYVWCVLSPFFVCVVCVESCLRMCGEWVTSKSYRSGVRSHGHALYCSLLQSVAACGSALQCFAFTCLEVMSHTQGWLVMCHAPCVVYYVLCAIVVLYMPYVVRVICFMHHMLYARTQGWLIICHVPCVVYYVPCHVPCDVL